MKQETTCGSWACSRVAIYQNKRNGRFYCSELCARDDLKGTSYGMSLEKIESTSEVPGEALAESLSESEGTPKEIKPSRGLSRNPFRRRESTTPLSSNPESLEEKNGDSDALETLSKFEEPTMQVGYVEILPEQSDGSIVSLEKALSDSTSICDQSIRSMHSLLNDVVQTVNNRKSEKYQGVDPKMVNAACNVAAQMANLMKMKLSHHKLVIKNRGKQ